MCYCMHINFTFLVAEKTLYDLLQQDSVSITQMEQVILSPPSPGIDLPLPPGTCTLCKKYAPIE